MKKHIKPEKNICPTCGYQINETHALRCPRCFTSLQPACGCSGSCGKCRSGKKC